MSQYYKWDEEKGCAPGFLDMLTHDIALVPSIDDINGVNQCSKICFKCSGKTDGKDRD